MANWQQSLLALSGSALFTWLGLVVLPDAAGYLLALAIVLFLAASAPYLRAANREKALQSWHAWLIGDGDRLWMHRAVEYFGNPALLEEARQADVKALDADAKVRRWTQSSPSSWSNAQVHQAIEKRRTLDPAAAAAAHKSVLAWQAVREDLERQLRAGDLIAWGFPGPHPSGDKPTLILRSQWEYLQLFVDLRGEAAGREEKYNGIKVGKRK